MTIQTIRDQLPDYAKDTKLNLGTLVTGDEVGGLTSQQAYGIALASAYACKQPDIISAVAGQVASVLSEADVTAAKAAATIMAMNNVYYRFIHLCSDKDYATMPAELRMRVIGNPGVDKAFFELMSLAVSAINGCGMCMEAHARELVTKHGVSKQGVQSSIRVASVINAAAQALTIEGVEGRATVRNQRRNI